MTGISIRRAAVRGVRLDAIAARRSTERLLGQISGAVPGMSASAVLCVRKLSVPVRNKSRHPEPASNILGSEMERLARHATRPVYGPAPSNAEAVLFADRAELLECLARDSLHHLLTQGWWWQALLQDSNLTAAAERLWIKEAAHAPAALARLACTQDAEAFVRTLGDACAVGLTQAVIRAHGLPLLAEGSTAAMPPQSHPEPISPAFVAQPHAGTRALEAEIRAALPEAQANGLSRPQRRLLAISLALARLPQWVRSTAFAQTLPVLLEEAGSFHAMPLSVSSNPRAPLKIHISSFRPRIGVRGKLQPESSISNGLDTGLRRCDEFLEGSGHHSIGKPGTNSILASLDAVRTQSGVRHTLATGKGNESLHPPDSRFTGNATSALYGVSPLLPAAQSIAASNNVAHYQMQVVETQYGGAFFLINAALALGLYPDFTRPLDRGLEMPLWDFLALAALDLGGPAVRRDPLWPLLANLAGRKPGQRPGAGFVPPHEWRMPVGWLLPFADDADDWTWEADAARLAVRHPAGFVVLDLPHSEMSAEEQLRVELAHYAVPGINPNNPLGRHSGAGRNPVKKNNLRSSQNFDVAPLAWGIFNHLDTGLRRYDAVSVNGLSGIKQAARCRRGPVTPLAHWRGWVMPYLGRRVARALGDVNWRRACQMLLCLQGRIELDAERLDVHLSLEQLPVAVRMASLDRDPGWVPAAGRDIRFHFGCDHA